MAGKKRDWDTLCKQADQAILSGEYSQSDFCRDKGISRVRLYQERAIRKRKAE
jgi:hypothetical protein